MYVVYLAIREFAVPVPKTGSIEAGLGYGNATAAGQELHVRIQNERSRSDPDYQPEYKLSHQFNQGKFRFNVGGRADGFFDADPPKIEEIKTSHTIHELSGALSEHPMTHPYSLQLKTYGYFYWKQFGKMPVLSMLLASTRGSETTALDIRLDIQEYEAWLSERLESLVAEAKRTQKRVALRKRSAKSLAFPYERARTGQTRLIETIENGIKAKRPMMLQAPTGLGKTVGVLFPVLKEALTRGQAVVYVTPKNSQHAAAEDALARLRSPGVSIQSLTITAKHKLCFKEEPICNPEYCEYAADHYTKVHANKLLEQPPPEPHLNAEVFRRLGMQHRVCPFELQMAMVPMADAIVCDYNYVFAGESRLEMDRMMGVGQEGKPSLVIDEAHNVPARAMGYYSPSLSSDVLSETLDALRKLPGALRRTAEDLVTGCIDCIRESKPDGPTEASKIALSPQLFLNHDVKVKGFLSTYLESTVAIRPRDAFLNFFFYWSNFIAAVEFFKDPNRTEFFATFHASVSGGTIFITCCDASKMLELAYERFEHVVAFSATLKPFDYYAKLSGFDITKIATEELNSPFPRQNRKLLLIPQVSTKLANRERNYAKIADGIRKIALVQRGNYLVSLPSFSFLERLVEQFTHGDEFSLLRQERDMAPATIRALLDGLRKSSRPTLLFAVQGGVLSEGVDYPGDMLIGAFVVGPPLPFFDLERDEMKKYYQDAYGLGFDYTYTFPAMAKSIQAAGRVIRSETDRGLIVLMDNRFLNANYAEAMPSDWFEHSATELVSNNILDDVTQFWRSSNPV